MLVVACIAGNAKADLWDQYQALGVIPLPPAAEPNFELGARYWASQGNTYFSFNSSKHDLRWAIRPQPSTMTTRTAIRARSLGVPNTLAKGFVGAGALSVANLDDHDFFAGYQILRH
jgi:hypothetical protein